MTASDHAPGYVPNPNYSQEDWDDVNSPEATDEQLAQMRPAAEAMPELVEAMRKRRGPNKTPTKALFSLRIDRDVLEAWRASGPGWQSRMGERLRELAADIGAAPGVDAFDIVPGKDEGTRQAEQDEADRRRDMRAVHVIQAVHDLAQRVENGTDTEADGTRVLKLVEELRGGLPLIELNLLADIINRARA